MKKLSLLIVLCFTLVYFACDTTKKTSSTKEEIKETITKAEEIIKPNGTIKFAAANDRYNANGTFKNWHFTDARMKGQEVSTLSASINVDLTSIWEKSDGLTEHLKAPDFFNIEKYTTAKIKIDNVQENKDGTYTADMKLMMKDLEQTMESQFEVVSRRPLRVKGTADVNRSLFGLGGEIGVGDFVTVTYDTEVPL